jgi:hypothetical protein
MRYLYLDNEVFITDCGIQRLIKNKNTTENKKLKDIFKNINISKNKKVRIKKQLGDKFERFLLR